MEAWRAMIRSVLACTLVIAGTLGAAEPEARALPLALADHAARFTSEPRNLSIRTARGHPQALPFRRPVALDHETREALVTGTTHEVSLEIPARTHLRLSAFVTLFAAGEREQVRAGRVEFSAELRAGTSILASTSQGVTVAAGEPPPAWLAMPEWKHLAAPPADAKHLTLILRTRSHDAAGNDLAPAAEVPAPLGVLAAWGMPLLSAPEAEPSGPLVFLLTFDTLRADRLAAYGQNLHALTPNVDALAARGYVFERCYSPSGWTLPAYQSLLSGLHPAQLGHALENLRDPAGEKFTFLRYGRAENLGHLLRKRLNAQSFAATGGGMLEPWQHNFLKGFSYYWSNPSLDPVLNDGRMRTEAQRNVERFLACVNARSSAPLFGFYHTYEPHTPYRDTRFAPALPAGRIQAPFGEGGYLAGGQKALHAEYTPEERAAIEALYNGDVSAADEALGELLDGLDRAGLRDRAWIIFTADHGEEFWEHGGFSHGHSLYDELLHVPLLIVPPAGLRSTVRLTEPVSLLDVLPTVCGMLKLTPPPNLLGRDLAPLLTPDAATRAQVKLPQPPGLFVHCATYHGPTRWAIRHGDLKFIHTLDVETWTRDEANRRMFRLEPEELYDLAKDPGERTNLAADPAYAAARKTLADSLHLLRARVLQPLELSPQQESLQPPPLDPALLEQLKKLGY
ncbi:MAG: hypothetical protein AMXMBFR7_29920 [Planctomycetota bacterium]